MPNIVDDRGEDVQLVNVTQVGEKCLHQLRRGHLRLVLLERVRPGGELRPGRGQHLPLSDEHGVGEPVSVCGEVLAHQPVDHLLSGAHET